jgi:hypothetical protein
MDEAPVREASEVTIPHLQADEEADGLGHYTVE